MTALEIFEKVNPIILSNVSWTGINLDDKKVEFGLQLWEEPNKDTVLTTVPSYKASMVSNHVVTLQDSLSPLGLKIIYKEVRGDGLVFNVVEN